jgi:hypothetical protein
VCVKHPQHFVKEMPLMTGNAIYTSFQNTENFAKVLLAAVNRAPEATKRAAG